MKLKRYIVIAIAYNGDIFRDEVTAYHVQHVMEKVSKEIDLYDVFTVNVTELVRAKVKDSSMYGRFGKG